MIDSESDQYNHYWYIFLYNFVEPPAPTGNCVIVTTLRKMGKFRKIFIFQWMFFQKCILCIQFVSVQTNFSAVFQDTLAKKKFVIRFQTKEPCWDVMWWRYVIFCLCYDMFIENIVMTNLNSF
jgi:hypothetical protein